MCGLSSPDRIARKNSTGQEHPDVLRGGLDHCSDRDDHAHQLHEANPTEPVAYGGLGQGSESLAGNVDGDDLATVRSPHLFRFSVTYGPGQALVGLVHIVNPALVGDS
jgi:hypothetical protein